MNRHCCNPCRFWGYALIFLFAFITIFYVIASRVRHRPSLFEGGDYHPLPNNALDLITTPLPGAPSKPEPNFKQYSGYITVDEAKGRRLFYYFVETSAPVADSKPLILWLNGVSVTGPGCSSVGMGAFVEIGPYGVQRDGSTLYTRTHSWNTVANLLFVESPVGVGFSYSNTTTDYDRVGNLLTSSDSYIFVKKWFARFPQYQDNDFHMAGESFASYFIAELAYLLIQSNFGAPKSSIIKLKGIMIGNGLISADPDERGIYDFWWGHMLISKQTYQGLIRNCIDSKTMDCEVFQNKSIDEMGSIYTYNIYAEDCPSNSSKQGVVGYRDPCERDYVRKYLNLPEVQKALHANATGLPYAWSFCSLLVKHWKDSPSMVAVYKKLLDAKLRILMYSGDVDAVIPATSTLNSIGSLNLTVMTGWRPWFDDTKKVAGYRIDYKEGLTFMSVLGAGHEVPWYQPRKALSLVKIYLDGQFNRL